MNNYDKIESQKDDLLVMLSTYQIITDSNVDFTQRMLDINSRLNQLRLESVAASETLVSDRSAYFVSHVDGYEQTFTIDSIDSITPEMIKDAQDTRIDDSRVVGKPIDGYEWLLAGVVDNTRKEYEIGSTVKLSFKTTAETFNGKIVDVRGSSEQTVIIFSCDQFNYDLVQHRCLDVKLIKGPYSGLKVPRESIRFKTITENIKDTETGIDSEVTKNYRGVYIREGEQVEFRKIDVVYEGSDYVLSAPNDDKSYLSLYDDILIEGENANVQ